MSFSAVEPFAYSKGFKNPSDGRPAAASSSLSSATTLANVLGPYIRANTDQFVAG